MLHIPRPQKLHKTTEDHSYKGTYGHTGPQKATQGHTSQFHTIMCHKRRQNFLIALEHFLFHLEHFNCEHFLFNIKLFLLMFPPRQEQEQQH